MEPDRGFNSVAVPDLRSFFLMLEGEGHLPARVRRIEGVVIGFSRMISEKWRIWCYAL